VPLKAGEIIKLPGTDGWYLIATRGSHRLYKHPDKSDVSAGTLAGREIRSYDGFKIPLDYLEVMVTGRTPWTAQVYTN